MNDKTAKLTAYQRAQLVSGCSFWRTHAFDHAEISGIKFSDGPAGLRVQSEKRADSMGLNSSRPATSFPCHSALACSFNPELAENVARRMGEECALFGVDILLAPAINIKRNPLNGRNFEYFSEDPYLSGVMGAKFIDGLQSTGVGACVKHFACNNKEFGRTVSDSAVDMRTLREIYLTPFEIAVKRASPRALMTAYNRLNGTFCNENKWLLQDVLRGEWGYGGMVISDWGGTHDRVSAIKAGADLEMPACKFSVNEIMSALENGALSEDELNACADRVVTASEKQFTKVECDFSEHSAYAEKCAEECAVLLKNQGALPLKSGQKVALVGSIAKRPVFQGGGSAHVNPTSLSSLLECFAGAENFVGYSKGYKGKKPRKSLIKRAVRLVKKADVAVVCIGLSAGDAEGIDRENICLPASQIELIRALKATGKSVVAVLSCGVAVDCSWDDCADALLFAGLNGQGGARAVYNILTGKANPSAKLAETFPESVGDVPSTLSFNENPYHAVYREGMNVGYRYFAGKPQKYPFGFGLSYTDFGYSDLEISEDGVEFTITNTGSADGAEIAQLYIEYPQSANSPLQLKGFTKVFLRAGESKRAGISFDEFSFRTFDENRGKWGIVGGQYVVSVRSSSIDARLSGNIVKTGDMSGATAPNTSDLTPENYVLNKDKKGRTVVDLHTPFCELKNSRAGLVRLVSRVALAVCKRNPTVGGTLTYAHIRIGAQFAKLDAVRAKGLVEVFNGRYMRGICKLIAGERRKNRR